MGILEIAVLAILLFITVEQAIAVAIFLAYCRKRPRALREEELPRALVVLALRGCDSTLRDCLRGLFQQDYPRYQVRVMVDNRDDPAWPVVQQAVAAFGASHVDVRALESPGQTCTLKCSALLQATADLDEAVEVVAFLDADVAPSPTWLRQLVAPLAAPRVEAAMGNRWYTPRVSRWGSLVRYLWNTSAVVNMHFWQVPWGGTLAVKAAVLRESNWRQLWTRAGCDDVPLYDVLRRRRTRLVFVPDLLLLSHDDCSLAACLRFVSRQMLWVRLYHPACWWVCALFNVLLFAAQLLAPILMVLAAWSGRWAAAGALVAVAALNFAMLLAMLAALERYVARATLRAKRSWPFWCKTMAAIPLTEVMSSIGLLLALCLRQVDWRGIRYQVRGPWKIRMLQYIPNRNHQAGDEEPTDGRESRVEGREPEEELKVES